jgi:hypothetical protein
MEPLEAIKRIRIDPCCISGTSALNKEQELDELKTELQTAKLHVKEAEEDQTNHSQKLKDFKLNLQTLKKTLFSAEKERVKVLHLFICFITLRHKNHMSNCCKS